MIGKITVQEAAAVLHVSQQFVRIGKGIHITDIMIAVKGKKNVSFIPCICWQNVADAAGKLKKGTYVEVEGRFQSREYKRAIEGSVPYLMTAYEVSVAQLGVAENDAEQKDE